MKNGIKVLKGEESFYTLKHKDNAQKTPLGSEPYNDDLFQELKLLRRELAEEKNVPPYVIFSDKSLHEMCRLFPVNESEFLQVNGVGEKKLIDYGEIFINKINSYLKENPEVKSFEAKDIVSEPILPIKKKKKVSETREVTWRMIQEGKNYVENF